MTPAPVLSNVSANSLQPNETVLKVEFDPSINVRYLISGFNIGWVDCGRTNECQCMIFFGAANEIMRVQFRFQVAFGMLKKMGKINKTLSCELFTAENNAHLLE